MLVSRDGNAEASCSRPLRGSPTSPCLPCRSTCRSDRTSLLLVMSCLPPYAAYRAPRALSLSHSHPGQPPSSASPPIFFIPSTSDSSDPSPPRRRIVPPQLRSMTAGAGAGLVASVVTCPLDVLKTALQANQQSHTSAEYEGVRKTAYRIWRQSGVRGFYRGLGPTLGGYLPTWGIYFTVYDLVKDKLGVLAKDSTHPGFDTAILHIFAAMSAGGTGTILTNPLWVVKTRFMAQATLPRDAPRYRHTLDAFVTIYRTEGLRAFYKGLIPSLFGLVHVAVQFPLYEKAKSWADQGSGGTPDHSSLSPSTILLCSAFSKMIASLATYPHEVLRTRLQMVRSHSGPGTDTKASTSNSQATSDSNSNNINNKMPKTSRGGYYIPPSESKPRLYSPHTGEPPEHRNGNGNGSGNGNGNGNGTSKWGRKGGIIDTAVKIKRQDGWRGFYRGLSINLVRTVPNSAVTMLTYELIMRRLA